ncbi:MAG: hypothetical protein COB37_11960 [Kordiimonadales bacterium]|nr:MAG: hypothetical protein COB37_11960 [Kordiimonadales bacterium]
MMLFFARIALIVCALPFLFPLPLAASEPIEAWAAKVNKEFSAKQRYPRKALDMKVQGLVKIRVQVAGSGHITGFTITSSSGQPVLDNEVLSLLQRVNPLPPLPDGVDSHSFNIPLRFQMDAAVALDAEVEIKSTTATWKSWRKKVGRILARNQGYPTELIKAGIEGTVRIRIEVATDGTITRRELVTSSGHNALDSDALDLMRRVDFPALPEDSEPLTIVVPFSYRIKGKR